MGVLPLNFVDGDILTAANVNQMLTARDGFVHPIDPTTRDEDDNVQDLGSASNRWKRLHANEATFGSTDDVTIGGKTLTQILEDNQIDAIGTEELLTNTVSNSATLLSASFVKVAGDLLIRFLITGNPLFVPALMTIAITNGKVETRTYSKPFGGGNARSGPPTNFLEWFDISQVANGATVQIDVTTDVGVDATTRILKNAF